MAAKHYFIGAALTGIALVLPACRNKVHPVTSLKAPVRIIKMEKFADGGTTYVYLRDASDKTLVVCFDARLETSTPLKLFIGAEHPTHKGARPATPAEDAEIIGILREIIDSRFTASRQKALLEGRSIVGLSEKEKHALWMLWIFEGRERLAGRRVD
ncbi:MAG TPA: hypothetical protein VMX13_09590 [Sedimentisphaerales bacterium]|nr:hypothetical protein [Sedimentisphaerales bacterium]